MKRLIPQINILLVDDEERYLATTQKLLENKGYHVETAMSGMEALEKLKILNITVVILDVKMPGMDGIATLQKIKRDFPLIEVIMLTGHATVEIAVEGVQLGAANFLLKPADIDIIAEKIEEALEKRNTTRAYADSRNEQFRKLKIRLAVGLITAFMLPYAAFFVYFQYQFTIALQNTGRLNLEALSNSQKNTIDLFLQERVVDIFTLFHDSEFTLPPPPHKMEQYLQRLRRINDAFVDVGFHNSLGQQVGYAGPFPDLHGKDYSNEVWFQMLMTQNRDFYISDIYLGFRNKPHFTIAVKHVISGNTCVMRSTLDPDKFYMLLRSISRGKSVESTIVNKEGLYQVVDPERGEVLGVSGYIPTVKEASGVTEIISGRDRILVGHAWLKEVPWALLVRQPLGVAHAELYKDRRMMTITLVAFSLCIAVGLWFANSKMIDRVQANTKKSDELRHQLFHASKLASVGELATGVAHEINNPLAVIVASSGVIRDLFNPEFNLNPTPESVLKEVENIDSAAFRARTITRQLLAFGRKNEPKLEACNVNRIIEEVIIGLKEREFKISGIEIIRQYDPGLPDILLDHDKIRQVFFNMINNAGDAISGTGTITIKTQRKDQEIEITFQDTGVGIAPEHLAQIFNPFFTTKEVGKGTGLGLSISLNIIESLGGNIVVQSIKGAGSQFKITLPIHRKD